MSQPKYAHSSSIDALTVGKLFDPHVPGLSIVASANGRKIWLYKRRIAKRDIVVELRLGAYPAYSIADARKWAIELNASVARGVDPRVEMRRTKQQLSLTVDKAHQLYMAAQQRGDRKALKPRTILDKQAIYTRDIGPRMGRMMLLTLTEDDCWNAVYNKARASKDRANKMAGELNTFLRWCSGREGRMAGIELFQHPAPSLNSNWFSAGPRANNRFLNDIEIALLIRSLVDESAIYRRGMLLLLLTAARRNELLAAATAEFVDGVWTLPASRSKNGEPNIVALGPWGRALAQSDGAWLFPSSRIDGPQLSGWFQARQRVHDRMEHFAGERIASWHFHDLRRTFRSNASRIGIDNEIAELMLNHKRRGIRAIYDKNQELELRAEGFAVWEAHLRRIAFDVGAAKALGLEVE